MTLGSIRHEIRITRPAETVWALAGDPARLHERPGVHLEPRPDAVLDAALQQLRTVARLSCAMEVWVRAQEFTVPVSLATRENQKLVFNLPAALLDGLTTPELVYHLAVATFFAMDTTPRVMHFLLR